MTHKPGAIRVMEFFGFDPINPLPISEAKLKVGVEPPLKLIVTYVIYGENLDKLLEGDLNLNKSKTKEAMKYYRKRKESEIKNYIDWDKPLCDLSTGKKYFLTGFNTGSSPSTVSVHYFDDDMKIWRYTITNIFGIGINKNIILRNCE